MVGGGLFVGLMYWYLYLTDEDNVQIEFDLGGLRSAEQAYGGPMRRTGKDSHPESEGSTTVGHDAVGPVPSNGSGHLMSALSRELGDSTPYAKTHAARNTPVGPKDENV